MIDTKFDISVERVMDTYIKAIDKYFEEEVDPMIEQISNPEKVIGKKFPLWTQNDLMMAFQIYQGMPEILNDFLFEQAYNEVETMKQDL